MSALLKFLNMDPEKQNIMGDFLSNAGISALQGAIDIGVSAFNNKIAEKSAQKQYERQLEFWHKQNDYNSPLAQRQRFQQAGMNPAAATGQMATSGTAQGLSSVPGNEYAQQGALKLEGLASILESVARIENLSADTGLKGSQLITESLRQCLTGLGIEKEKVEIAIKEYEKGVAEKRYKRIDDFIEAELQNLLSQANASQASANESQANADSTNALLPFEIEKITSEISLNEMTTILREAQSKEAKAAAANQYSQARLNKINADLTEKYGDAKAAAELKDAQTKADYCASLMQSALDLQSSTIMLNKNQALTNDSRVVIEQQAQVLKERALELEKDKFGLEQNKFELEAVRAGVDAVTKIIDTATPW